MTSAADRLRDSYLRASAYGLECSELGGKHDFVLLSDYEELADWAADAADALEKYHEWLERHEGQSTYIGLDHKIGENVEGCEGCALLARLEHITGKESIGQ